MVGVMGVIVGVDAPTTTPAFSAVAALTLARGCRVSCTVGHVTLWSNLRLSYVSISINLG